MQVFIIGATGYVGTHIARSFLSAGHAVQGLCRDDSGAAKLEALGIIPASGTLDDLSTLAEAVRAADATIFTARVMEAGSTRRREQDIVRGLLALLEGTGRTFIFTSGTGVLGQHTAGDWSEQSFGEDDPFRWPPVLTRRVETERLVRDAAARGVRGIVIRPPLIWGHELPSHAVHILRSVHAAGAACYVGRGLNCYTDVHIEDLADLYRLAAERGEAGALYHATQGEIPVRWMAERIAAAFGVGTRSVSIGEGAALWGEYNARAVMGACSRSRSPRARGELGWSPQRHDMLADIERIMLRIETDPAETDRILNRRPPN
ncbi:MAG: NAD-dependent epimerase/dehydratase family protein [Sphingomonas sp.]